MAAQTQVQVQLVLRLTLGLIFMVSALTKLRDISAFVHGVLEYGVLPHPLAQLYGRLLPFCELGTALLLLSGLFPLIATGVAVLMLLSFAVANCVVVIQGRQMNCHCFGASQHQRAGWPTLARGLTLLVPALWLLIVAATQMVKTDTWRRVVFGIDPGSGALAIVLASTYLLVTHGIDLLLTMTNAVGHMGERWD